MLVARAKATVWDVRRSAAGVIGNLEKKTAFVNHFFFHIMVPPAVATTPLDRHWPAARTSSMQPPVPGGTSTR